MIIFGGHRPVPASALVVARLAGVLCVKMLGSWEPYLAKQITGALTFVPWLPRESTAASVVFVVGAVAATLLLGLVVGLLHALMINQLRLPPFIATLATMAGLRSVAIVLGEVSITWVAVPMFRAFGYNNWFAVPIFLGLALVMGVILGWSVLGRHPRQAATSSPRGSKRAPDAAARRPPIASRASSRPSAASSSPATRAGPTR